MLNVCTFAQDSLKVKKDSTFSSIILLAESKYEYINPSLPDTITRKRFLWYPLKTIDDLFNYVPGYYLNYMDIGQVNQLHFNQLDHHYTALMRNGRPLNDLLDGSVDFNLLSRNEISEIELTNGFGNFLYNYSNGINIVNHQIFRFRPYSEISYLQDRYENLYFDGSYDQNIFKKFNFNFGITKNSYDGRYVNSDFDKWQGRFNFNFFPNSRFNSFLYANYAKIQRGLNEGIDPTKIILDKENLFNVNIDTVTNPDAYEIRERFDVDLGFIYAYGKNRNSFTKVQLYTSNSIRKYRDEENRPTPNGIYFIDNSHWIDYGIKLQQVLNYNLTKGIDVVTKTEAEYDKDLISSNIVQLTKADRIYFLENIYLLTKHFGLNAFAKAYKFQYFGNKFFIDYGVKPELKFDLSKSAAISLYGVFNVSNKLPTYQQYYMDKYLYGENDGVIPYKEDVTSMTAGSSFMLGFGKLKLEYFYNSVKNYIFNNIDSVIYLISHRMIKTNGLNAILHLNVYNFELDLNLTRNLNPPNYWFSTNPGYAGNVSLAYHNVFFKEKLEIKIGVASHFWSDYHPAFYNGFFNDFSSRLLRLYTEEQSRNIKINSNATLDFFIIGKINKATFGLTFENLLNRLYLTTGVYPYQDRGGLFNVWSRFNITWYFLN
jgi:TonB-dependent Receptor Plug Domain